VPYCTHCGAQEQQDQQFCTVCGTKVGESAPASLQLPYFPMDPVNEPKRTGLAGYWWRVLAFFIDSLLLALVIEVPAKAMDLGFYGSLAVLTVATFLYGTLLIAYQNGQTIGMKVTKIQVVQTDRSPGIGLKQAALRNGLYGVLLLIGSVAHYTAYVHPTHQEAVEVLRHSTIVLALLVPHILDLLWPLWDTENQTLHDKFAKTVVLRGQS